MRYRAFISYSNVDRRAGEQFQRSIERFRIPRSLRGVDRGFGVVPARLTPLFRDRSDADAAVSLAAVLRTALEQSSALVVLCSPASARSRWVNEEIRTFKALGRAARIFPVLVDGTPRRFDPETAPDGAFPPALFERVAPDGAVIGVETAEPLAPDVRPTGDGPRLATWKIVAALTGIPLTELTERQLEAERRERAIVRAVAAAMAVLALVATVAAVQAWRSANEAQERLGNAIQMAARRVDDGAALRESYGVPIEVVRGLLDGARRDFATLIGEGRTEVPALELERGRLLTLFSGFYRAVGESGQQLALAREALATLQPIPTSRHPLRPSTWFARLPSPEARLAEELNALEALGVALAGEGETEEAMATLERGRSLAERAGRPEYVARFWSLLGDERYLGGDLEGALAAADAALAALDLDTEATADRPIDRAIARLDRAELLLESGRHAEALSEQDAAVATLEARVAAAPGDVEALRSLGHALARRADMQYAVTGAWDAAIPGIERALEIVDRVHASDRARVDYARDVSIALERLGDARLQTGDLDGAGAAFARALELRRDRLARDPESEDARRDLAVALERQADLARGRGAPRAAVTALDEALALRTASSGSAADDPVLIRDLAVLWSKAGAARVEAGPGDAWEEAFTRAIDLMTPLVARPGAPPGWLRDLAVFRSTYADALARVGRRPEARAQWTGALELIQRQLALDPSDPRLLADQQVLEERLAR